MGLFYKIFVFLLLSLTFPFGKLYDIFIWDVRIIKTESVFDKHSKEPKGKRSFFLKSSKEIKKVSSGNSICKPDFSLFERITKNNILDSFSTQNGKVNTIKTLFIRRFHFNMLYIDESDMRLLL